MTDTISKFFGGEYMDTLHDYPSHTSNIRYYHRLKARIVKKFIKKTAGAEKNILDTGAGRGPYSYFATSYFKSVYCDEYSKEELSKAEQFIVQKEKIGSVIFKNNDLTNTDYPSNFFDSIICSEVLEHIPEREKALQELYRILKPGGKILISMPQKQSLFYLRVRKKHQHLFEKPEPAVEDPEWETYQHLKFSSADIRKLINDAGFRKTSTYGANVLPLGEKVFSIIYKIPALFIVYLYLELTLEKIFPFWGSFYFIEATKDRE